jgi:glyoxylase-like metal-dependent hydrolase (beta-lactamase superfamily II)
LCFAGTDSKLPEGVLVAFGQICVLSHDGVGEKHFSEGVRTMEQLELIGVTSSSHVISGKYGIGVYLDRISKTAVLIDSGPNSAVIEEVCALISAKGYQLYAVVHTHGHAVNVGGSSFLKKKFPDIQIYATHLTSYIMENPHLDPLFYDIGIVTDAKPGPVMENVSPLVTDYIPYNEGTLHIHSIPLRIVPLPGHSPGMIGVITPDHVLYCGDALFGPKTLNKQDLLLFNDLKAAKASLRKLAMMRQHSYVLYHGGAYKTITGLVNKHLSIMKDTSDFVAALIKEQPSTIEQLVQKVMKKNEFEDELLRYGLTASIIRSYLKELQQAKRIVADVDNGVLVFRTVAVT